MPVLTQRVVSSSTGLSRAIPSCQSQALRSGASMSTSSRGLANNMGAVPSEAGRRTKEQLVPAHPAFSSPSASRSDGLSDQDRSAAQKAQAAVLNSTTSSGALKAASHGQQQQSTEAKSADSFPADSAAEATATAVIVPMMTREDHEAPVLSTSIGDIVPGPPGTVYVPLLGGGPLSPAHSSAPCSPASSINLSGPCSSVVHSSSYRLTSSSGVGPEAGYLSMPAPANKGAVAAACTAPEVHSVQEQSYGRASHLQQVEMRQGAREESEFLEAGCAHARSLGDNVPEQQQQQQQQQEQQELSSVSPAAGVSLPSLSHFAAAHYSNCSSRRSSLRDQNSVTIKATTVVKDAAGAIDKILSRGVTALVTALRSGNPPYASPYDSLNQAVKAIAVARQYAKETGPEGSEVTFLPFHRYDNTERPDPSRFAFLVFPVPHLAETLKTADETVLNVARGSDVHKMAGAIIAVMLDRGQAVMKAAGADAIFVAMSAVVNARHRLVQKHGFDLMLAAAWITEDTVSTMGRESKFLRFNILKTEPAGPKGDALPALSSCLEAC